MQKWEYLEVIFDNAGGYSAPRWVNDQDIKDWKRGNKYNYLAQLGQQGWELVAIISPSEREYYTFKRPIA